LRRKAIVLVTEAQNHWHCRAITFIDVVTYSTHSSSGAGEQSREKTRPGTSHSDN
jgi:hypothetical protein